MTVVLYHISRVKQLKANLTLHTHTRTQTHIHMHTHANSSRITLRIHALQSVCSVQAVLSFHPNEAKRTFMGPCTRVCAAVTEAALNEHTREREENTLGKRDVKSRGRPWDWCSSASKSVQNPWHYRTGRPISRGWGWVGGGIYQVCIKAISRLEVSVGGRCGLMRIAVLKRRFVDLWLTGPVFLCRFSNSCVL